MAESQSRYGIMIELNNKKLQEKQAIANIEALKAREENEKLDNINNIKKSIVNTESSYEIDHQRWKVKRLSDIAVLKSQMTAQIDAINDEIETKNANYQHDFMTWKEVQERNIEIYERELANYTKIKNKEIEAKKEILAEIDAGIENLKEISKEQKS